MMPTQPDPAQIRAAVEAMKARITVLEGLQQAYAANRDQLPAGGTLNGLQAVCGEEVKELSTDPVRALLAALWDAAELEANALRAQMEVYQQMLPGHVMLARSRPRLA